MDLKVMVFDGKTYYGCPDRWHDISNKMYLITSNTLVRELNRMYLEKDAQSRYEKEQ